MRNNNLDSSASIHFIRVPFSRSVIFLFMHIRLLFFSLLLFIITFGVTWLVYQISIHFINQFAESHFINSPDAGSIFGWIKYQSWVLFKWVFMIISRIISFYIAFLISYCVTTPGYAFLSASVEKIHFGKQSEIEERFSLNGIYMDLVEGCKIGLFGIVVTVIALFVNFIPGIGQVLVFLLYSYYSCLMFIDYPASRRRWTLGKKINWLKNNPLAAFRLGIIPAIISMIPVLNIFLIALLFPLLTVHATLNFLMLEAAKDHNNNPQTTTNIN
jgi:CysZ protein